MPTLPSGFTIEYDCKMQIRTEKSAYDVLSQADHKIELSFERAGKLFHYETTFTDLIKILDNSDIEYSQSRKLIPDK